MLTPDVVDEVERLELAPGETLLVHVSEPIDANAVGRIKAHLERAVRLPAGAAVAVVGPGVRFEVLAPAELQFTITPADRETHGDSGAFSKAFLDARFAYGQLIDRLEARHGLLHNQPTVRITVTVDE